MAVALFRSVSVAAVVVAGIGLAPGQVSANDRGAQIAGPLVAIISLKQQSFSLYNSTGLVRSSTVSSGLSEHPTPIGIFSVLEKRREHTSNIYDAEMPFMQRLTWSGIALHEGRVTGRPASHGCVRLPGTFASELFGITGVGMRVIIAHSATTPVGVTHDALFVPRPSGAPGEASPSQVPASAGVAGASEKPETLRGEELIAARKAARVVARTAAKAEEDVKKSLASLLSELGRLNKAMDAAEKTAKQAERAVLQTERRVADSSSTGPARDKLDQALEAAIAKRADAELRLRDAQAALSAKREANEEPLKRVEAAEGEAKTTWEEFRRLMRMGEPVSVMISTKTGLLQVRQAFDPILEAPVTIADVGAPLGTHVFTLMNAADEQAAPGTSANWTVVTMPMVAGDGSSFGKPGAGQADAADLPPTASAVSSARAALDRIEIPATARARIEALLVPGSSLIVTDEGPSRETGKFTDFIVELNQPQPKTEAPVVRDRSSPATASLSRSVPRQALKAASYYRPLPSRGFQSDR